MITGATAAHPRLLFVIDNDFGELHMAMLFVHGRPLAGQTTFLLAPRLFALNGGKLPVRTLPYSSAADLHAAVEAESPDVVILCSAYLLPFHHLMAIADLELLIRAIRDRGCQVVTTDPFWGLMAAETPRIEPPYGVLATAAGPAKTLIHLYPAPVEIDDVRSVAVFNPSIVDADVPPVSDALWAAGRVAAPRDAMPFWLFPLTTEDYLAQITALRIDGFIDRLVQLFKDAIAAGRRPVLIAPEECVQLVSLRMEPPGVAALFPYCEYVLFASLLIGAEHVFYWNAGSTSCYLRIVRGLSVFTFDDGHVARVMHGWLERTARYFYDGQHPPRLDQRDQLRPDRLADLAARYRPVEEQIRSNLMRLPAPEALVTELAQLAPSGS